MPVPWRSALPSMLLLLAAAGTPLAAQATSRPAEQQPPAALRSAPVSNLRYVLRFDRQTAGSRQFHVMTTMNVDGTAPVLLSLPAWTPGAYDMTYFARWVSGFQAQGGGRALRWDKVDPDTWRIEPAGAREITVAFDYTADSLDTAMSWAREDFAFFNGTNVFLYPEGRPLDFRATVRIETEPEWRVATGMTETAPRQYEAPTYHDLVDMPTFVGRFDYDSMQVTGTWLRFATYPAGSVTGELRQTIWQQLRRMLPPQAMVFDTIPWGRHYTILQVTDSTSGGGSGLEHQNSHLDIVSPLALGSLPLAGLYAHEIFHAWNVKRLRPEELWPYRYDRMQPTTLLWMSEGVTDYYADLSLVRGGVIDARQFYRLIENKATSVAITRPVALEDASLSTWIHPADGTAYIYYDKGSLAGLLLDILIRDASDNASSLDRVMRTLYETEYERGSGFTDAEFWAAAERAANGRSLAEFRARYVDGRDPYPYTTVLPLAGLRVQEIRMPRLGVTTVPSGDSVRVAEVEPGSSAGDAGVRPGDVLLAVGDVEVTDPDFGERYRERYGQAPEGSALSIRVQRSGSTLTLSGQIRYAVVGITVTEDPAASVKARRIREGILLGRTTR